jgi:hypothetical protein
MEAFMVTDSRPGYTMACDLELNFQGRLDRAACEAGLAFALARHPLFRFTIGPMQDGALAWQDSGQSPPVQWASLDDPLDDSYGAPFDLTLQPGLRVWVRRGEDQSKILLHYHHACSDGLGVNGFAEDFLVAYHNAFPGSAPVEPRLLEMERLLIRGEIGMGVRSAWRKFADVFIGAREGIKLLLQRPASIASGDASSSQAPPARPMRPAFLSIRLSEATTRGLRQIASHADATTNDVLIRELFVLLARWNEAHGGISPRRLLRILVPQNLREGDDDKMPLANAIGFAFVTRKAGWRQRPAELLASIHRETKAIREGKLSLYFLGGMGTVRAAGLLPALVNGPFCFATAVLTNLGDATRLFRAALPRAGDDVRVGNVTYQGMVGVPPVRPGTGVVFLIAYHGTTMSVTYAWDWQRIDPESGRQILDEYVAQLDALAQQADTADAAKEVSRS